MKSLINLSKPKQRWIGILVLCVLLRRQGYAIQELQTSFINGGTRWIFMSGSIFLWMILFSFPLHLWFQGRKYIIKTPKYIQQQDYPKLGQKMLILTLVSYVLVSYGTGFLMIVSDCFPRSINAVRCENWGAIAMFSGWRIIAHAVVFAVLLILVFGLAFFIAKFQAKKS